MRRKTKEKALRRRQAEVKNRRRQENKSAYQELVQEKQRLLDEAKTRAAIQ